MGSVLMKDRPPLVRTVENRKFQRQEGVSIPIESVIGYANFYANDKADPAPALVRISDVAFVANMNLGEGLKSFEDSSVRRVDRRTGQVHLSDADRTAKERRLEHAANEAVNLLGANVSPEQPASRVWAYLEAGREKKWTLEM